MRGEDERGDVRRELRVVGRGRLPEGAVFEDRLLVQVLEPRISKASLGDLNVAEVDGEQQGFAHFLTVAMGEKKRDNLERNGKRTPACLPVSTVAVIAHFQMLVLDGQPHGRATELIGDIDVELGILLDDSIDRVIISVLARVDELLLKADFLNETTPAGMIRGVNGSTHSVPCATLVDLFVQTRSSGGHGGGGAGRASSPHVGLCARAEMSGLHGRESTTSD